jgi:glycoside/pentoside/hexuronide:cation symporter, GPH family
MTHHKLTILEKIGFGAGDMAVNVVISSMMLIITYFYTDVYGLKPSDLALMFIAVRGLDAVADPTMGMITDRVTTRWGRYRPYFLIFAVPFGVAVYLCFSTPDLAYNAKLVYAYVTFGMVMLIFTAVTIPYISIISVLTDDPQERLSANGYRLFFAKIAAFLVTIIVPQLAERWSTHGYAAGYRNAMGLMGLLATVLFLFCFFNTKERIKHEVDKKTFFQQMQLLLKNDQWMILAAVCLVGTIGYVIRGSVAAYYAKYYLHGSAWLLSMFLSTGVAAAILAMVASTWITKRVCKIKLFRFSQLATAVLSVAMFFLVKQNAVLLAFILYFLLSFIVDLHAPIFWSAIAEAVDYGAVKSGQRVSGIAFGGISFFQKAGMGIAGAVVGMLLTYYNYVPDKPQSDFTLTGIALMLSLIPGFFHLLMGLLMYKYRITNAYYAELKQGRLPAAAH